jgi:hypothetical protein
MTVVSSTAFFGFCDCYRTSATGTKSVEVSCSEKTGSERQAAKPLPYVRLESAVRSKAEVRQGLPMNSPPHQISISVPNSTTCLAGTPKNAAERSALRCRKANSDSRHTHMPGMSSLGMMVSRPM